MPPLAEKSEKLISALLTSRVVAITLLPAFRASEAMDLPRPDEAPVISQVNRVAVMVPCLVELDEIGLEAGFHQIEYLEVRES